MIKSADKYESNATKTETNNHITNGEFFQVWTAKRTNLNVNWWYSPIILIRADADQSSSSQVKEDVKVEQAHQDCRADQNCSRSSSSSSSSSREAVFDQGTSNRQNGHAEEEFKVSRNFCLDSFNFELFPEPSYSFKVSRAWDGTLERKEAIVYG